MDRFADSLLAHPRRWAAILALAILACGAILVQRGIFFDYSLENFLPASDPSIQIWRGFSERYEPDDAFLTIGFDVDDVFSAQTLNDLRAMTDRLSAQDGVADVVSVVTLSNLRGTLDGISVEPYIGDRIQTHPDSLDAYREAILGDADAVGYVVNAEGDATALLVRIDTEQNDYEGRSAVLEGVRAVMAGYPAYEVHYSGFPYIRNEYVNLLQIETVKYVGLSSLVILLVLVWLFRSVRGVVLPLVTVYLGVLATVAVQMLFRSPIDVLTSTIAAIILVVGVADSMHLLVKYYHGLGEGLTKREAIRRMVIRLGAATFLTSVTTAIGFGTLTTSVVVPMKRFGLFAAVGVILTFAISIVLVTLVLLAIPAPKSPSVDRLGRGRLSAWLGRIDTFAEHRARGIIAVSAVLVGLGLFGATKLTINTFINDEMGPRTQVYQDIVWFESRLVPPWQFEVLLQSDPGRFKTPEALRQAEAVADWLEARPEVRRVTGAPALVRRLNRALHADSLAYDRIPDDPDLLAQQLFLLELTDPDLVTTFADMDYSEIRLASLMNDVGSARIKTFRADLDAFLAQTLPADVQVEQTGTIVLGANMSDYLVRSLLVSIGLAFLFISILMAGLFRNARLVVISLIPNVVPLVLVAGFMGFVGIDISPGTAVIFSIAFGIAVDDTIHVLARLKQELAAGLALRDALRTTIMGTGKALVLTSLVLLGGFGALMTSRFEGTAYLGGLVSLTVLLALVADLFLLPALVHVLNPKLQARRTETEPEPVS